MKKIYSILMVGLVAAIAAVVMTSCGDNDPEKRGYQARSLNLKGVSQLMVLSKYDVSQHVSQSPTLHAPAAETASSGVLFGLDESGNLSPISIQFTTSSEGENTTTRQMTESLLLQTTNMLNMGSDYILLTGCLFLCEDIENCSNAVKNFLENQEENSYLLRKSDGLIYSLNYGYDYYATLDANALMDAGVVVQIGNELLVLVESTPGVPGLDFQLAYLDESLGRVWGGRILRLRPNGNQIDVIDIFPQDNYEGNGFVFQTSGGMAAAEDGSIFTLLTLEGATYITMIRPDNTMKVFETQLLTPGNFNVYSIGGKVMFGGKRTPYGKIVISGDDAFVENINDFFCEDTGQSGHWEISTYTPIYSASSTLRWTCKDLWNVYVAETNVEENTVHYFVVPGDFPVNPFFHYDSDGIAYVIDESQFSGLHGLYGVRKYDLYALSSTLIEFDYSAVRSEIADALSFRYAFNKQAQTYILSYIFPDGHTLVITIPLTGPSAGMATLDEINESTVPAGMLVTSLTPIN